MVSFDTCCEKLSWIDTNIISQAAYPEAATEPYQSLGMTETDGRRAQHHDGMMSHRLYTLRRSSALSNYLHRDRHGGRSRNWSESSRSRPQGIQISPLRPHKRW
jgi:hypothetical protein